MRRTHINSVTGLILSFFLSLPSTLCAAPATLGTGDLLEVSILSRELLSGNFRVREDGTISLHLVGRVDAVGLTITELETLLERKLSESTEMLASVTIEVVAWRPVYVMGDVATAGSYDYAEGLTVGRLLAQSGGLFPRAEAATGSTLELRLSETAGQIEQHRLRIAGLVAERARLQAEAEGAQDLTLDDLAGLGDLTDSLLDEQSAILRSRAESFAAQLDALRESAAIAELEADSLARQQIVLEEQIADTQENLAQMQSMVERGLASADRLREAQRNLNSDKIELMLAASYEARARQEKIAAEGAESALHTSNRRDIAEALAEVASALRQEQADLAAAETMLRQFTPLIGAAALQSELLPPAYRISRITPDAEIKIPARIEDQLLPGDLLEVRRGGWNDPPEDSLTRNETGTPGN